MCRYFGSSLLIAKPTTSTMSAYAALQGGQLFNEEEETVIKYENSSDDESEQLLGAPVQKDPYAPGIDQIKPSFSITNENNFITQKDGILIGLKVNEAVTLSGQFSLIIERGAILINGCEYYHAPQEFKIILPRLTNLPTISSTQVLNTNEVSDIKTEDNAHLFTSDFKSIIRIKNMTTGLENVGKYFQPFKNLFKLRDDNYSFDVNFSTQEGILFNDQISGLEDVHDPRSFITIGNKNSGKSTISKLLINKLINNNIPVSVLDLDPGQSEYSKPYCLSITNHYTTIHGFNYHQDLENDVQYYYGASSPQTNPQLYLRIIESLIQYYFQVLKHKGHFLIINTPGWVKGYGKQLLVEITKLINPDHLILLSSNITDNDDILQDLTFQNLQVLKGSFQQSKYSPVDFRTFNKLIHFHKIGPKSYDFTTHLLQRSPLKLPFQTEDPESSAGNGFNGIDLVTILNHDLDLNFNWEDLTLMLDMSIVGLYFIDHEYFQSHYHLFHYSSGKLPYLNSSDYSEMVEYNSTMVKFIGVGLIHSINPVNNYMNFYFPPDQDISHSKALLQEGYKLMVVKGESDIPSCEVLMPQLLEKYKKAYKKASKAKEPLPLLPYVNYNNKINGVWKVRRNVMRRGQQ